MSEAEKALEEIDNQVELEQEATDMLTTVLSTASGVFIGTAITLMHVGKSEELELAVTTYLTLYLTQLMTQGVTEEDIGFLLAQAQAIADQTDDDLYKVNHYILGICVENLLEIKMNQADAAAVTAN